MKNKLSHILLLLAMTGLLFAAETPEILLIGNSYFNYNNQPQMLKAMCDSAGQPAIIGSYLKNGTSLLDHTRDDDALAKIASREWDVVAVIGGNRGVAYPREFSELKTYLSILTLDGRVHQANESGRLVYVMPWAFEDGMLWVEGWTDDYSAMQKKIYDNSLQWVRYNDFTVAPVGRAWQEVLDSLNFPLHYLFYPDMNHPSLKGSYLMTCVLYCTIFQDSCINNSYTAGLPAAEAAWYQELTSTMVLDSPELWNLPSLETSTYFNVSTLQQFNLFCFPNPFNSTIKINLTFPVLSAQRSVLKIYDVSGKLVKELYNGYLEAGQHEMDFDASGSPGGVYLVSVQRGNDFQTQKVLFLP